MSRRTGPPGAPNGDVRVVRREQCDPEFWRHLYSTVGQAYRWVDRLPWTDDEIRAYLADPAVSLWVLTVGGTVAGYFELRCGAAWAGGARRVWLHTCSFDHPFAIQNYLDRGFTVFKTEQYLVVSPA